MPVIATSLIVLFINIILVWWNGHPVFTADSTPFFFSFVGWIFLVIFLFILRGWYVTTGLLIFPLIAIGLSIVSIFTTGSFSSWADNAVIRPEKTVRETSNFSADMSIFTYGGDNNGLYVEITNNSNNLLDYVRISCDFMYNSTDIATTKTALVYTVNNIHSKYLTPGLRYQKLLFSSAEMTRFRVNASDTKCRMIDATFVKVDRFDIDIKVYMDRKFDLPRFDITNNNDFAISNIILLCTYSNGKNKQMPAKEWNVPTDSRKTPLQPGETRLYYSADKNVFDVISCSLVTAKKIER